MMRTCAYCGESRPANQFPTRHFARCHVCQHKMLVLEDKSAAHEVILGTIIVAVIVIIALVSWCFG